MKIVVTDGYALNPGDLSWKPIEELGDLKVYDRTSAKLVVERCRDAEIILTNKTEIDKSAIDQLSGLKLISVLATGYNVVDTASAKNKNITVCNVPAYGTASVAQHTFALILELTNHISIHAKSVANGEWQQSPDYSYSIKPLIELSGKTLGIIGMGNIGQQTARIAKAFGMKVIYHSRHDKKTNLGEYTDLDTLFAKSDIVSLHCPLTPENKEFVNTSFLKLMKPSAYIINTSRGQLINESDLAEALDADLIAGAALDVLSKEPPQDNNPLLKAKNCVITPHNAWSTREARQRIIDTTAANIQSFTHGHPQHVVN